jgi:hypothetical protein
MALPDDVDYSDKNVRVFTRGLRTTVAALEAAGADAQDMKEVFRKAANVVYHRVQPPVLTGRLKKSMRVGVLKNKATIKLGGAKVPYAARIEYGVNLHHKTSSKTTKIPGHFFLREAVRQGRHQALTTIVEGLTELFHKHGLGDPPVKITGYIVKSNSKAYSTDSKYLS